jgi:hypothetical protein
MILFENKLQSLINSLDQGIGLSLLRVFLALCLILGLFGLHAWSQFRGLREPEAMECAQLGRNLVERGAWLTRCIRPVDLQQVSSRPGRAADLNAFPDVRNPPAFPAVLAAGFRLLRPSFDVAPDGRLFSPEKTVILPLGFFFSAATALLLFRLGARLFSPRVGLTASLVYVVSLSVLEAGTSGTSLPLATFLATAASYAAVAGVLRRDEGRRLPAWLPAMLVSMLCCAALFLTRYALWIMLPTLAAFVAGSLESRRWVAAALFVAGACLAVSPWVKRNLDVTGTPFGLAPQTMLQETTIYPAQSFDRTPQPQLSSDRVVRALKAKLLANVPKLFSRDLRTLGEGFAICFFLASFFYPFEGTANRFRWCLAVGLLLAILVLSLAEPASLRYLQVFLPLAVLYGVAFFFALQEQTEAPETGWSNLLAGVLVLLSAAPALLQTAGPPARTPYPPYSPTFIAYVTGLLDPREALCTDIPWATAWYGDRTSILLPRSLGDFARLNTPERDIHALYLTTETGNRPYTQDLVSGPYRSWLPVLNRRLPPDFPLTNGIALPPGGHDQLFLTDRVRRAKPSEGHPAKEE